MDAPEDPRIATIDDARPVGGRRAAPTPRAGGPRPISRPLRATADEGDSRG